MPKKANALAEVVERDVTVHNLATHMQRLGADDPKKADDAASYVMKRYTEDGLAIPGGGADKSLAWYSSWGTPPKCPTCGVPAKITNEQGEI